MVCRVAAGMDTEINDSARTPRRETSGAAFFIASCTGVWYNESNLKERRGEDGQMDVRRRG